MLYTDTFIIAPKTLSLAKKLLKFQLFSNFNLVGGTALALQIGHRNSIDLDFFSNEDFDTEEVKELLNESFKNLKIVYERSNALVAIVEGVKVDFIKHNYPHINKPLLVDGIRMLSKQDMAAMKMNAIVNSGQRLKDFIDIFYLLELFTMNEIIEFYIYKYPIMNPLIALKALVFFDEIDPDLDPPKLKIPLPLIQIKQRIEKAVLKPDLKF